MSSNFTDHSMFVLARGIYSNQWSAAFCKAPEGNYDPAGLIQLFHWSESSFPAAPGGPDGVSVEYVVYRISASEDQIRDYWKRSIVDIRDEDERQEIERITGKVIENYEELPYMVAFDPDVEHRNLYIKKHTDVINVVELGLCIKEI